MAFPTTGILDNFNRADEGPPPSASWGTSLNGLRVKTNQLTGDVGNTLSIGYWLASVLSNCEAYITINTLSNEYAGVFARIQNPTDWPDTFTGYLVEWDESNEEIIIYRVDSGGTFVQLGSVISQPLVGGYKLGIKCVGDTISAYYDIGGGWALAGSRTDATYSGTGYIGVEVSDKDPGVFLDDFGGGMIAPVPQAVISYYRRRV